MEKWNRSFAALEKYKKEYGDCDVPRGFTTLGRWVDNQRKKYNEGSLAEDRSKRLEGLGFHFKARASNWEKNFSDLKAFKDEHGDCNVPYKYVANNRFLGHWVNTQRQSYRNGKLSDEQKDRLESVGFLWNRKNPPVPVSNDFDSNAGNDNRNVSEETEGSTPMGLNGMPSEIETGRGTKRKLGVNEKIRGRAKRTKRSTAAKILGRSEQSAARNPNGRRSASLNHHNGDEVQRGHVCEHTVGKIDATRKHAKRVVRKPRKNQSNKEGGHKLERIEHGEEQCGSVEVKWEEETIGGDFEVDVQKGLGDRIESSRDDLVGDSKRRVGDDEEGSDLRVPGSEEKSSGKKPVDSTSGTSLEGNVNEGGGTPAQILLKSSGDLNRAQAAESPISPAWKMPSSERGRAATNPSTPNGQTGDKELDKDLADKQETKIKSLEDENDKLTKKVEEQETKSKEQETKIKSLEDELAQRGNN